MPYASNGDKRIKGKEEEMDFLLKDSVDRFHFPGDKLSTINALEHEIETTDDKPINTKQYRYPPVLTDKSNRRVKQLKQLKMKQSNHQITRMKTKCPKGIAHIQ